MPNALEAFREKLADRKRHRMMTECPQAQAGSHYLAGYKAAMQDAIECLQPVIANAEKDERARCADIAEGWEGPFTEAKMEAGVYARLIAANIRGLE